MRFDKDRSAGYLANHLARLFARHLAERIQPLGLMPAQFMVLLELWREDGLMQRDLVARLDVEQATMANTLARMERDGLIERRTHPSDARVRHVHVTAKGRNLERPATLAARDVNALALSALDQAEREQLVALLGRMVEHMRRMGRGEADG